MHSQSVLGHTGNGTGGREDFFRETGFHHVPPEETLKPDSSSEGEELPADIWADLAPRYEVDGREDETVVWEGRIVRYDGQWQ